MKRCVASVVCAAMLFGAGGASAGPIDRDSLDTDSKAWFYNRPGSTQAQALADLESCLAFGRRMTPKASGGGSGVLGVVLDVALTSAMTAGPVRAISDDCMIGMGYRRFETRDRNMDAFIARFSAMDAATRAAMMGAETPPEGVLARQWENTYWIRTEADPPAQIRPDMKSPQPLVYVPPTPVRALASTAPIAPGPNDAVIMVAIRHETDGDARPSVVFTRDDPATGQPAAAAMGSNVRQRWVNRWATFEVRAEKLPAGAAPGSRTRQLFVVPAGTYGLDKVTIGFSVSRFCYGTVAFTAAPGAVVDLGEIVLRTGSNDVYPYATQAPVQLRINRPNIDANRGMLARAPELAARLEPAAFKNGLPHTCPVLGSEIVSMYGFDIPGAPWLNAPAAATTPAQ